MYPISPSAVRDTPHYFIEPKRFSGLTEPLPPPHPKITLVMQLQVVLPDSVAPLNALCVS